VGAGKDFIVDSCDGTTLHANIAAGFHALRVCGGGQVVRASHRCAPVEEESAVIICTVVHAHASDVAAIQISTAGNGVLRPTVGNIDATEDKTRFCDIQSIELRVEAVVLGLTTHKCICIRVVRVHSALDFLQAFAGGFDLFVQVREQRIHVLLLFGAGIKHVCHEAVSFLTNARRLIDATR